MFVAYLKEWRAVAEMTMRTLASGPQQYPNITFLGRFDSASGLLIPESGPAQCSVAGDFLLAYRLFGEFELYDFGLVRVPPIESDRIC